MQNDLCRDTLVHPPSVSKISVYLKKPLQVRLDPWTVLFSLRPTRNLYILGVFTSLHKVIRCKLLETFNSMSCYGFKLTVLISPSVDPFQANKGGSFPSTRHIDS